jgi:anti-anti-sigma factor
VTSLKANASEKMVGWRRRSRLEYNRQNQEAKMDMTILGRTDDITHIALSGRLDTNASEEIEDDFSQAIAAREQPAIIDLSQVDFMASRGIGLLLGSSKRLRKSGYKLVLLNPQQLVDSSLRTARMEIVMPIAYDFDEAVRIVRGLQCTAPTPGASEAHLPQPDGEPLVAPLAQVSLKLAIKNELADLKNVNATLAQFLQAHHVPKRAAYAVSLAIDELVVNVMRYAYIDDELHIIDLELAIQGDQIVLRITDDGRPFDPRTGPQLDLHAEDRQVGGLGLLLVLDMVDALKYQRAEEKNCVEVRIHLRSEDDRTDFRQATGSPGGSSASSVLSAE